MKHLLVYILTLLLLLPDKAGGQEFRIIPQEISVHNDSLHLILSMDLNNIKTGSLTALTFTPVLADKTHRLPLPQSLSAEQNATATTNANRLYREKPLLLLTIFSGGTSRNW